jgi:homospermidine synthase
LLKHFNAKNILILSADKKNISVSAKYNVDHIIVKITQQNYQQQLSRYLAPGYMLVNLSVNVSSQDLVVMCNQMNVLYMDTCIEPWEGYYTDNTLPPEKRTNYSLRQDILDLKQSWQSTNQPNTPTAIIAHGANPGMVNHFAKRALIHVAEKILNDQTLPQPTTQFEWATLAKSVGLKTIHISERDTQTPKFAKEVDEFVNTWSVDGFISKSLQPSELAWGTHEQHWPHDAHRYDWGCKSAIWLNQPGCMTKVRSWTPDHGPMHAWLITHNESISMGDWFHRFDYQPTVHYSYHPCDSAVLSIHELAGNQFHPQLHQRLILDEIQNGVDELGVLLMGTYNNQHWAYWYGSLLDIRTARRFLPHNNATSVQVVAPVLAAILYAIDNPNLGIVEADQLPYDQMLIYSDPYMEQLVGEWTDWTPLENRNNLFPEDIDLSDPWQFKNFRVS